MDVRVVDVHTNKITTLLDVVRVGVSEQMRPKLAGIWDASPHEGISINVFGPFVISCAFVEEDRAWKLPLIKEPDNERP